MKKRLQKAQSCSVSQETSYFYTICRFIAVPTKERCYSSEFFDVKFVQFFKNMDDNVIKAQIHWPFGLRNGSKATRLLGMRVRISPVAWMSVYCECCVLSGTGLCDESITRPEEFYRVWRV